MNMEIKSITVLKSNVMDKIFLKTTLPSPAPGVTDQNAILELSAAYDYGVDYVVENFGVKESEIEIINTRY